MTITELTQKYNFHDSLVTKLDFNDQICQLIITIEFCLWAQEEYIEGNPEVSMIELVFHDVTSFNAAGLNGDIDYFSILDAIPNGDMLALNILDDFHDEYYELSIESPSVDFLCKD